MRVLRRVVGRRTGDETYSLTMSVALFAIGETEVPVRGRSLRAFIGALADAVETQDGLAEADVVRLQLERELKPLLVEPRRAEVSSGIRQKVATVDRTTVPVQDPLARFHSPTIPAMPEVPHDHGDEDDDLASTG